MTIDAKPQKTEKSTNKYTRFSIIASIQSFLWMAGLYLTVTDFDHEKDILGIGFMILFLATTFFTFAGSLISLILAIIGNLKKQKAIGSA